MPARGWIAVQPRGHQENPSARLITVIMVLKVCGGALSPLELKLRAFLLFPRYLVRCLRAAQDPAPPLDELSVH